MILTLVIFLAIIAALVFVHELGHFLAAKISGVRVDEFCVGFPPRIFSKRSGETIYSIGALPLGGFVKIFGEDGEDGESSFMKKSRPIRIFILISGIIGNIVFAWMLFSIALMIDHTAFFSALYDGAKLTGATLQGIVSSFGQLAADAVRGVNDFGSLTGPVGIAELVGQARGMGSAYLLSFTAFISLNLAFVNLLPFPALDGGRIIFVIIEAIRRKNISAKVTNIVNTAGFSILMLLILIVTIKDIIGIWK